MLALFPLHCRSYSAFYIYNCIYVSGQAFQRLGKPAQARQAFEAGVIAGKEGGDVLIFVQLVDALAQPAAAAADTEAPDVATGRGPASTSHAKSGNCLGVPASTAEHAITTGVKVEIASSPEMGGTSRPELLGAGSSACVVALEKLAPCAECVSARTSHSGDGGDVSAEAIAAQEEEGEASEEEQELGNTEMVGAAVGAVEEGALATAKKKKKKKKKSRSKRNKAGKATWAGEEDEYGHRLTLSANTEGGGVSVDGLSEVLAASNITHSLLEAARAQLCHSVGNPDIDNLIALGYLQVMLREPVRGVFVFFLTVQFHEGKPYCHECVSWRCSMSPYWALQREKQEGKHVKRFCSIDHTKQLGLLG